MANKKVLLLGGAGFIGINIAKYLAKNRNYEITIADNFSRGQMDTDLTKLVDENNIEVIKGDFTIPSGRERYSKNFWRPCCRIVELLELKIFYFI